MDRIAFLIELGGIETLKVEDIGEGCVVISQRGESGQVESVTTECAPLLSALAQIAQRYGPGDNVDPNPVLDI